MAMSVLEIWQCRY